MTPVLHLGHQPSDLFGATGWLNATDAAIFDAALDSNGLRYLVSRLANVPFGFVCAEPAGDLWVQVRYRTPNNDAANITDSDACWLEIHAADGQLLAAIRPQTDTNGYHAFAHGDTTEKSSSFWLAGDNTPCWIDLRLAVGADITLDFHVDGALMASATAANTAGKGKPVRVTFANRALHGAFQNRVLGYAHIAALDGVSTIGRRFLRRVPAAPGAFSQMSGSLAALADGNIGTRVRSDAAGQRLSFTLGGPTGPAAVTGIAAVHVRQIAQAGTGAPQQAGAFLRLGGVNHDAAAHPVSSLQPAAILSSWATNPADGSPWDTASLPAEIGIFSA
ncbi:MAG: FscB [Pararhodobacter sp.]